MKGPEAAVLALAARQHTVFSRGQALRAGMTARQIELRQASGHLVTIHRAVYGVAGAPPSFERSLMAACLAGAGVASHRSAAALWRLRGCEPGTVDIVVHRRRRPELAGVVAHTTDRLEAIDVTERLRIPVTTPGRTLLDLGAVADATTVESALEDAVLRDLVSVAWLHRTVERLGEPGRSGAGVLKRLLAERDAATAPTDSMLEDALLRLLRRAGLPDPVRQYLVPVPGHPAVRLDLAYPPLLLGIEADGRLWHSGRADVQRNCAKGNLLVGLGWRVLHFTWADVHRRPAYVVGVVRNEMEAARPAAERIFPAC